MGVAELPGAFSLSPVRGPMGAVGREHADFLRLRIENGETPIG